MTTSIETVRVRTTWRIKARQMCKRPVGHTATLAMLVVLLAGLGTKSAFAQQLDESHFHEVEKCGTTFFGNPPPKIIAAVLAKHLGPVFKRTLLKAMSPYAPSYPKLTSIDPLSRGGVSKLILLNTYEIFREKRLVDPVPANVLVGVFTYYMALAAGNQCEIPDDVRAWVAGLAYAKLAKYPDVKGAPFAQLDAQQADMQVCAERAFKAKGQSLSLSDVARWIAANGKTPEITASARKAFAKSLDVARLDAGIVAEPGLRTQLRLANDKEAQAYQSMSVLDIVANHDPDFVVRLESRLLYSYYLALASGANCKIPEQSRRVLDGLNVKHS